MGLRPGGRTRGVTDPPILDLVARRSRKRDYGAGHIPLNVGAVIHGWAQDETTSDGRSWKVRPTTGSSSAGKSYRCPGCQQLIAASSAHLVVWPADHLFGDQAGLDDRRHWHTACWRARRG